LLRDGRSKAAEFFRKLNDFQLSQETDLSNMETAETSLAGAQSKLVDIARQCGLEKLGERLNSSHIAALTSLITLRERGARRSADNLILQSRLELLRGGIPLPPSSISSLIEHFDYVVELFDEHVRINEEIKKHGKEIHNAIEGRPSAEYLVKDSSYSHENLQSKIDELQDESEDCDGKIENLQHESGGISREKNDLEEKSDLPLILFKVEQAEMALREAVSEAAALRLAAEFVGEVKADVEQRNQPNIIRVAGELVNEVTKGEWSRLIIDDESGVLKVVYRSGTLRASNSLSTGATDVLRLAVRIAVADEHAQRHGVALPLLCDDPSGGVDSERSPKIIGILQRASVQRQVILFTHDEETVGLAVAAGALAVDLAIV
jgi:DNA repair exonuclease SbcCD ATPase subunit